MLSTSRSWVQNYWARTRVSQTNITYHPPSHPRTIHRFKSNIHHQKLSIVKLSTSKFLFRNRIYDKSQTVTSKSCSLLSPRSPLRKQSSFQIVLGHCLTRIRTSTTNDLERTRCSEFWKLFPFSILSINPPISPNSGHFSLSLSLFLSLMANY